jgi:hypothetical protein
MVPELRGGKGRLGNGVDSVLIRFGKIAWVRERSSGWRRDGGVMSLQLNCPYDYECSLLPSLN